MLVSDVERASLAWSVVVLFITFEEGRLGSFNGSGWYVGMSVRILFSLAEEKMIVGYMSQGRAFLHLLTSPSSAYSCSPHLCATCSVTSASRGGRRFQLRPQLRIQHRITHRCPPPPSRLHSFREAQNHRGSKWSQLTRRLALWHARGGDVMRHSWRQ